MECVSAWWFWVLVGALVVSIGALGIVFVGARVLGRVLDGVGRRR